MKAIFVLLCLLSTGIFAQNKIEYVYDANGNRSIRRLYVCPSCPLNGREASTSSQVDTATARHHGLAVYPNPTQDKITVSLSNLKENESAEVLVIDEEGKVMFKDKDFRQQSNLAMDGFKQGVYFVKVIIGKDVMVYKILKIQ